MNIPRLCRIFASGVLALSGSLFAQSEEANADALRDLHESITLQALSRQGDGNTAFVFLTTYGRSFVGRTSMIPVRSTYESSVDRKVRVFNLTPRLLEVISEPDILAGKKDGYVRVRGLAPGKGALVVDGNRLEVDVVELNDRDIKGWRKPILVGPPEGAYVWGEFSLGAEYFDPLADINTKLPKLRMKLPDGRIIKPRIRNGLSSPILQHEVFELRATRFEPGPQKFSVLAEFDDGTVYESDPYYLNIAHPRYADLLKGECEDFAYGPRPARAGENMPQVRQDPEATGGQYVPGGYPMWVWSHHFEEDGVYQMMMQVRGSYAAGAFPTLGLQMDEQGQPDTAARAVDTHWHRIAVGKPFHVQAGQRFVTVRFMNSFNRGANHRRFLDLDNFQLLRVDDPTASARSQVAMMPDDPSAMRGPPREEENGGSILMEPSMMDASMVSSGNILISMIPEDKRLRVMFNDSFDGEYVNGAVTVRARARWDKKQITEEPEVGLVLNKSMFGTLRGGDVYFEIPRNKLITGWNTLELIARNSIGEVATSVEQRVYNPDSLVPGPGPTERYVFPVENANWSKGTQPFLSNDRRLRGRKVAALKSKSRIVLNIPENLMGEYRILVEVFGDNYKGAAEGLVTLTQGQHEKELGVVKAKDNVLEIEAGIARFPAGPKQLRIDFINDFYEGGKADRNLYVGGVAIERGNSYQDTHKPLAKIAYPDAEDGMYGFDAVVANAIDDTALKSVRLLIDGEPYGDRQKPDNGLGAFVFPLVLRDFEPGKHLLQIEAEDVYGQKTKTEPVAINVLEKQPEKLTRFERAVRLMDRFAYGIERKELAKILTKGERAWLVDQLTVSPERGDIQAMDIAKAGYPVSNNVYHIQVRAVEHLLRTNAPARARFVQWTQNHFSTWIRKVGASDKWDEYETFYTLGASPFQDLLLASLTSPAMLQYLDQDRSFVNRINENYARELLELHTLGVNNGYTQNDVTQLANLLTGITVSEEADRSGSGRTLPGNFRYEGALGSGQEFRLLWTKFRPAKPELRFDRIRHVIEMLAASPNTAEYVTHKLLQHYVANEPDKEMHSFLQKVFVATGGDMRSVLVAMTEHPAFWERDLPPRFISHRDYSIRLLRTGGTVNAGWAHRMTQAAGMGMFDKDTPDGYPEEDAAYAGSNGLIQRWKLAKDSEGSRPVLVPYSLLKEDLSDPRVIQAIIDHTAWRLLGKPLSEASNKAAMDVFMSSDKDARGRAKELATLIAMLPESNLR